MESTYNNTSSGFFPPLVYLCLVGAHQLFGVRGDPGSEPRSPFLTSRIGVIYRRRCPYAPYPDTPGVGSGFKCGPCCPIVPCGGHTYPFCHPVWGWYTCPQWQGFGPCAYVVEGPPNIKLAVVAVTAANPRSALRTMVPVSFSRHAPQLLSIKSDSFNRVADERRARMPAELLQGRVV
jgi:hypothetical protein